MVSKSAAKKAKVPPGEYVVRVGMNLSHRDEERYEPGDPIDAEHVTAWMLADGVVEGPPVEAEEESKEGTGASDDGVSVSAPGGPSDESEA